VNVLLYGAGGKVGRVLGLALGEAGHEVVNVTPGLAVDPQGHEIAIDFTRPDAARSNVERCLAAGVPCIVGTTGLGPEALDAFDAAAREQGIPCFVAPNFALGAVLMMRFAAEAGRYMPRAEIVELHNEAKVDAPSGTAKATAESLPGDVPIHSVRLPGLVAHQEVLFGGDGQLLTIRHDIYSREAFVPGVLLALERLPELPPGVTVGLDALLGPGPREGDAGAVE
jgi:4-hydroxy-tetrahydrodipicolinate reductase